VEDLKPLLLVEVKKRGALMKESSPGGGSELEE